MFLCFCSGAWLWSRCIRAGKIALLGTILALASSLLHAAICPISTITTVLDVTAPIGGSDTVTATGTQTGRLLRNGVPSSCASPKASPGLNDATVVRRYDAYTYTPAFTGCLTVILTQPTTTLFVYAVSSFNPASPAANYLADPGSSGANTTFSLNVTAGVPLDIIVHEVNANGGLNTTYTLALQNECSVPDAPTIGAATPGNGSASIAFAAPGNDGGSPITGYTASCTGGGSTFTGTGAASPIAVGGLANGTAYACSVTATNSAGTGPASATATVTPTDPVASIPTLSEWAMLLLGGLLGGLAWRERRRATSPC